MSETRTMTQAEAVNEIRKSRGSFFGVTFIKKDNSKRDMTARLGVKKHLKTGKPSTTNHIPKYITVFDVVKKAYRNINVNTISALKINGASYEVG